MGCVCVKQAEIPPAAVEPQPDYFWNSRKNLDPKDYLIEQFDNGVTWKLPGSIRGEQFIIQNCTNSIIYLLDHCDSVLIDECNHCKVIIGPTKGSVFIRNVKNSVFMIACGQFRASNCYNMSVFLLTATVATVEAVSSLYLSCYQLNYQNLEEQFDAAGLSVYNNKWSSVYDFTPGAGEANVKIMSDEMKVEEFFPKPPSEFERFDWSYEKMSSVVPYTHSIKALNSSDPCILVFLFRSESQKDDAKLFVRGMHFFESCKLLYTSNSPLGKDAADLIRTVTTSLDEFNKGNAITLIYAGTDVRNHANQVIAEIGMSPGTYKIFGGAPDAQSLAQKFVASAAFTDS